MVAQDYPTVIYKGKIDRRKFWQWFGKWLADVAPGYGGDPRVESYQWMDRSEWTLLAPWLNAPVPIQWGMRIGRLPDDDFTLEVCDKRGPFLSIEFADDNVAVTALRDLPEHAERLPELLEWKWEECTADKLSKELTENDKQDIEMVRRIEELRTKGRRYIDAYRIVGVDERQGRRMREKWAAHLDD